MRARRVEGKARLLPIALLLGLMPQIAMGADPNECVASHRVVQIARRDHRLLEARRAVSVCADNACPSLIGSDCRQWLVDLDAQIPTVVLDARTRDGTPIVLDRAFADGQELRDKATGAALSVDPGEHVFRIEAAGYVPVEKRAVVLEGQRAQAIPFELRDVTVAAAPTRRSRNLALPIVLGGVGIAALGLSLGFAVDGLARKGELDDLGCRPNCDDGRVTAIQRSFVVSDVSLAVGIVSLAAAAVLLLVQPGRSSPRATASR